MSDALAILISGASTGIGRATAIHLASRGFLVFAGVRKEADRIAIEQVSGGSVRGILLDVTAQESIEAAVEALSQAVGSNGLHGLVNNAGMAVIGPIETLTTDDWRRQFDVNLFGTIAVTKACLPLLRARVAHSGFGSARIVQISSIAAHFGQPILSPYSASKAALRSMSEALRIELRRQGIHVSMIEPGPVKSDIWGKGRQSSSLPMSIDAITRERYGPEMDAIVKIASDAESKAIDAIHVAKLIERALTARRPFLRKLVTRDAHLSAFMHWLLPDRLWNALLLRVLSIHK